MAQLLDALGYLHRQNIVHRDLKPENILLQRAVPGSSKPPQVKIADFGLAKLIGNEKVTSTFCGTPQYFAPEVLGRRESRRGYDAACDMWSLGVILYILLCGYPPFYGDNDRQIFKRVSEGRFSFPSPERVLSVRRLEPQKKHATRPGGTTSRATRATS